MSAVSLGKGLSLIPWKLRDQSTLLLLVVEEGVWSAGRSSGEGESERPVWERLFVVVVLLVLVGLLGVDVDVDVDADGGCLAVVVCERDAITPG